MDGGAAVPKLLMSVAKNYVKTTRLRSITNVSEWAYHKTLI